ncbi:MAG TPA: hypothetical protein PK523_00955 [Elusimicrobiales bacterium]|nr:hypothetical protein [Elusimicrobiales bacterium]
MKTGLAMTSRRAARYAAALLLCAPPLGAQFLPTTPLPQALMSHSVLTMNGRVYVAGGISDTGGVKGQGGYLNNVYYSAQMNPDGSLGAWQVASPMPELLGLGMHASLAHDGRLYVLGGNNLFGPRDVVYHASAGEDGSLAAWQTTTPLPEKLAVHSAAASASRVYVTGGIIRSAGATSAVYSAEFNADGTLGTWRPETPLPARLFGHQSMVREGRLIVLGGSEDHTIYMDGQPAGAISARVLSAAINPDGTLGAWQELSPLPEPMMLHAAAATSNSVYVFGGFNGGVMNAVYFAPFLEDGGLGDWQALHALPENLLSLAALATDDYVYTLGGGLSYVDEPRDAVYFLKVKSELKAFVRLLPRTLNARSRGKWVHVMLGFAEGDAGFIDPESVRITAVDGRTITPIYADLPKHSGKFFWRNGYDDRDDHADWDGDDDYADDDRAFRSRLSGHRLAVFRFSRRDIQKAMTGEGQVEIKVEGSLTDGRSFSGESVGRALNKRPRFVYELRQRVGERVGPGGVKVHLPEGSFKGNPELLLTAAPEEAAAVTKTEKEKRDNGMKARGMAAAGRPFEFGPHGMTFGTPVKISLPYDRNAVVPGRALAVGYWNAGKSEWELLASTVDEENGLVSAETAHFSVYQVMTASPADVPVPDAALAFGEVYVFPNPAVNRRPVIHAEVPAGDGMTVKVYTASGRLADEGRVSGAPGQVDDGAGPESAYEYEVREKLQAGVYYFTAEVTKGAQKISRSGKFAVLR